MQFFLFLFLFSFFTHRKKQEKRQRQTPEEAKQFGLIDEVVDETIQLMIDNAEKQKGSDEDIRYQ